MELPNDTKNFRARRAPWPWIIATAVLLAVLLVVGPMDYAEQLDLEAEAKVLRAEIASLRPLPRAHTRSPISKDCRPLQYYADQPDGGAWLFRCLDMDLSKKKKGIRS